METLRVTLYLLKAILETSLLLGNRQSTVKRTLKYFYDCIHVALHLADSAFRILQRLTK